MGNSLSVQFMKANFHLLPLLLASIAAFAMTMTRYSQSPPKVPVRRRTSPLRLPWRDAAMLAAMAMTPPWAVAGTFVWPKSFVSQAATVSPPAARRVSASSQEHRRNKRKTWNGARFLMTFLTLDSIRVGSSRPTGKRVRSRPKRGLWCGGSMVTDRPPKTSAEWLLWF